MLKSSILLCFNESVGINIYAPAIGKGRRQVKDLVRSFSILHTRCIGIIQEEQLVLGLCATIQPVNKLSIIKKDWHLAI